MKLSIPILVAAFAVGFVSCTKHEPSDLSKVSLIPMPVSVKPAGGSFELTSGTVIYIEDQSSSKRPGTTEAVTKIGKMLAAQLNVSTGFDIQVKEDPSVSGTGNIFLRIVDTLDPSDPNMRNISDEGYLLQITESDVYVRARGPEGIFYGVQTLRQLFPARIESTTLQQGPWEIATGAIVDFPEYAFRGSMLDLGRHFFGVDDVKRYIDLIAAFKMNILHLHLSDDQGWRIEIKSWPNLTTHGGSSEVGGGKGGFFTQEQYKDIVQYAADRFVTIIPEIDTPGHTNAALASYPELNCNGKAPELYTGTSVGFSTLCAQKDITYKFMDDVVRELAEITPGPWIHIGGDESHATKKEDYILYVNKAQDIVQAHGKQMIGWDEISQATLKGNTVAQFWTNEKFANAAAAQGAKIIMSPAKKAYVDMMYDTSSKLGQHWAAYIEVDSAYMWDPATYAKGIERKNILGIESPLWTETITKMDDIEYMVFPRMLGYAEIAWSPAGKRSWGEYKVRLGQHGPRLKAMNIDFYQSKLVPWVEAPAAIAVAK